MTPTDDELRALRRRVEVLEARRALDVAAQRVRDLVDEGRRSPLAAEGEISAERAEALVAEIRSGRSRRSESPDDL